MSKKMCEQIKILISPELSGFSLDEALFRREGL
jgi:hypothetical protein